MAAALRVSESTARREATASLTAVSSGDLCDLTLTTTGPPRLLGEFLDGRDLLGVGPDGPWGVRKESNGLWSPHEIEENSAPRGIHEVAVDLRDRRDDEPVGAGQLRSGDRC